MRNRNQQFKLLTTSFLNQIDVFIPNFFIKIDTAKSKSAISKLIIISFSIRYLLGTICVQLHLLIILVTFNCELVTSQGWKGLSNTAFKGSWQKFDLERSKKKENN